MKTIKDYKDSMVYGAVIFLLPMLALLLATIFTMKGAYIANLQFLVCVCSLLVIHLTVYKKALKFMLPLWLIIIIVFNPFVPLRLEHKTWLITDIVSAVTFFIGFIRLYLR